MLPELTFSQARPPARKFFECGIHSGWSVTCVSPTDFFAKVRRTRCPPSRVKKRPYDALSQAKFSFRHRGHRTGVHTGANSTPLEGGPWRTPFGLSHVSSKFLCFPRDLSLAGQRCGRRAVSERVGTCRPSVSTRYGWCSSSVPLPCSASCDDASQKRKSKSTIAVQYNILNEHIWQRAHMARLRRPYQTPLTCLHVACAQVLGHDTGSRRSVALRCAWREGRRHRRRAAPCIPALGSVVPS